MLGVTGKLGLWIVLNENYGEDPRLAGVDFPRSHRTRAGAAPSPSRDCAAARPPRR